MDFRKPNDYHNLIKIESHSEYHIRERKREKGLGIRQKERLSEEGREKKSNESI